MGIYTQLTDTRNLYIKGTYANWSVERKLIVTTYFNVPLLNG
jgi:hypothetical protein